MKTETHSMLHSDVMMSNGLIGFGCTQLVIWRFSKLCPLLFAFSLRHHGLLYWYTGKIQINQLLEHVDSLIDLICILLLGLLYGQQVAVYGFLTNDQKFVTKSIQDLIGLRTMTGNTALQLYVITVLSLIQWFMVFNNTHVLQQRKK